MWQSSNSRLRSIMASKERNRQKREHSFRMVRIGAELKMPAPLGTVPEVIETRMILNDFSSTGAAVFSRRPIQVGIDIGLTIKEPRLLYVKGRVVGCHEIGNDGHVIQADPHPYRIVIRFEFKNEEEKKALEQFFAAECKELLGEPIETKAA